MLSGLRVHILLIQDILSCSVTTFVVLDIIKSSTTIKHDFSVTVKTEISRPPQDKQVAKGATAIFECGVSHDPGIVVTWQWVFRSRQTEEVIVNDMLRTVYPNGTLEIRSCGSSDIGEYTCLVSSDGGNDNRTVSLAVIGRLKTLS